MSEARCPQCGYELPESVREHPQCLSCGWKSPPADCKVCRFSMMAVLASLVFGVIAWLLWPVVGESKVQPPHWTPAPSGDLLRSIEVNALPAPPKPSDEQAR
jgi:hypothetical protein